MIVYNADQEASQAADGWYDDRKDFPVPGEVKTVAQVPEKPRGKPGRKPKAKG